MKYFDSYYLNHKKRIDSYITILTGNTYTTPVYPGGFKLTQKSFRSLYYKIIEIETGITTKYLLHQNKEARKKALSKNKKMEYFS